MHMKVKAERAAFPVRLGLLAPVVLAALVACGGGSDSALPLLPPPAPNDGSTNPVVAKAKTTVLVYINGSDLESGLSPDGNGGFKRIHGGMAATDNIHDMLQARFGSDVNVVLETGGTLKDGWRTLARKQVKNQQLVDLPPPANPLASMADPATLTDFLTWGARTFPAEQYVLFFWNHGGGPLGGFGVDQITPHNGSPGMPVTAIQSALESAVAEIGQKFELIGFDACLMASLEIASALSNVGNYYAASSDIEPGAGWDYQAVLGELARRPNATGEQLGRRIANSYVARNEGRSHDLTFSVTDLRRIPALQTAVDRVFSDFSAALQRDQLPAWTSLAAARARTLDFQTDIYRGANSYDLIDLGGFLNAAPLNDLSLSHSLTQARNALADAVVFRRWGSGLESNSGLTLYFPAQTLRNSYFGQLYQTKSAASDALRQFNQDYVNFVLNGHVPTPVVGQPTVQQGGALFSTLSNSLYESGYGVLQDASGAIISTQIGERAESGLTLPTPDRWPSLMGVPLLMASAFDPKAESAEFIVPAALAPDCTPRKGLLPFDKATGNVGYLVVAKTGTGTSAQYRVTGHHAHTGSGLHGLASRLLPVPPGACFALPQLRFDNDGSLNYEFTLKRFVQFSNQVDHELSFAPRNLAGHHVYTAVSDYTGQLLFSPTPASYN